MPRSFPTESTAHNSQRPNAAGLYRPQYEHDACGLAFVAHIGGQRSHDIVTQGLAALCRLEHRGAQGAEANTGDGAGISLQIPDEFLRANVSFELPPNGNYATGLVFLPTDAIALNTALELVEYYAHAEGIQVLGWREVPTETTGIGNTAKSTMPLIRQVFITAPDSNNKLLTGVALERVAYRFRKRVEHAARDQGITIYFPSLSARTLVYKGMLTAPQLGDFYPELGDSRLKSALALVHSRFSTNTFPAWSLAHPYRFVAHNGEINTIRGNRNWMAARETLLESELLGGDLRELLPICTPGNSDSASFDEVLELLHLAGRSLPHALLMMVPPAWENLTDLTDRQRAFYRFHSCLMEPWDGPACVTFTDGDQIGAVLDRNGLRPGRWWRTHDDLIVFASETGVLDIAPERIAAKGRLAPGRMLLVDTSAGRIVDDTEIIDSLAADRPYQQWLKHGVTPLNKLTSVYPGNSFLEIDTLHAQRTFGYTEEELKVILLPMARLGAEPTGSMGTDTPIAVLSQRPRLLYDYFAQAFAQVTNPPLDALREELVTSVSTLIGPAGNLLHPGPDSCRRIALDSPILNDEQVARLINIGAKQLVGLYPIAEGETGLAQRLMELGDQAVALVAGGAQLLVLSDQGTTADRAPIPSLLLLSAVHQRLLAANLRANVGLVVQTADARTVHHIALLIGFGAVAVNPYLALHTVADAANNGELGGLSASDATGNYCKALIKGLLKIMSKMGIATVASYCGAQIFEAIGLDATVTATYFPDTLSRIGGVGLDVIAAEVAARHAFAWEPNVGQRVHRRLQVGGEYQWRREGEVHLFNPETVFLLQHATRSKQYEIFRKYTDLVNSLTREAGSLRGLFEFQIGQRPAVPLEEVEPVESIVRRFATGAMSYGSLSAEAHETLAIAMNRLGGRSNTGEGGEDPARLYDPIRRSSTKQVASGRFGVTSEYLVNADEIQIKMAQGAKPGEGGQLPGNKVLPWIARTRYSTPGVGLISPPPHHDIYSIEDLAQLIYDLKNANPAARISVKLVASSGVGTIAAGVAKAHGDAVMISGHDGGTGASPLNSIKHAGAPWELGLAETQQTLLLNKLRDRITVQVDGQLKTGRDVVVAALLGAEEFGFATAPLIVSGCVMMRVCHLDTCPVGVATQNPELRKRFTGTPEFVENFFLFLAQEVREYLAQLGFRTLAEVIGHTELLATQGAITHWKAHGLNLAPLLHVPDPDMNLARTKTQPQQHGLSQTVDTELIRLAQPALATKQPVHAELAIQNTNRTVGTRLGSEVSRLYGGAGLADDTINFTLRGSAGQSFGAFLPSGITLRLLGDANDYVGKGLSGGRIILRPDSAVSFAAEDNIIAGNTVLYGATSGELFCSGQVGERFAVRNSGATAVVEGVGDHGCEYMTGGTVVVLGPTGRNFAAGMSGGVAYVYRLDTARVNRELVEVNPLSEHDVHMLQTLLARYRAETGSVVAANLLAQWPQACQQFARVMPREYRKMLTVISQAQAEGRDVDAAVMEVVTGG